MSRLPVIVGFGGISPAGRSSSHHGYRRLVIDKLSQADADQTYLSLASLMGHDVNAGKLSAKKKAYILDHTLIRKLEKNLFDPDTIRRHKMAQLSSTDEGPISFTLKRNQLPDVMPANWKVTNFDADDTGKGTVGVEIHDSLDILLLDHRTSQVQSAGQLPTGFDPEKLYQSRNHPRGLQLTVYGASDAIQSLGIDWQTIRQKVPADQISVYASSAMGQLDTNGSGGMLQASLVGKRVSSKNCALGLADMTADFINAYILGSIGTTGANVGACATFLYNLRQGIEDIRSGRYRAVLVGTSEAPLTPEVLEGYRTMGALAEDEALMKLDGLASGEADYRRACRPFAENCGFTLSEAAQFFILFDDELAVEMGATIYGSIADVFINADGFKKSIPGPGIGNYVTVAKSIAIARSIIGEKALRTNTYFHAHGTGTPQNRATESHIINEMAKQFRLDNWPIAAIKAYLGHSLATSSGDQLAATLGTWQYGLIPGIKTVDQIADDVHTSHVNYLLDHLEISPNDIDAVFINAKGFGGNNATATVLAPHITSKMLTKKYGKEAMRQHARLQEPVGDKIREYDLCAIAGKTSPIYHFGEGVVEGEDLRITAEKISVPGLEQEISLNLTNPYDDMV